MAIPNRIARAVLLKIIFDIPLIIRNPLVPNQAIPATKSKPLFVTYGIYLFKLSIALYV